MVKYVGVKIESRLDLSSYHENEFDHDVVKSLKVIRKYIKSLVTL